MEEMLDRLIPALIAFCLISFVSVLRKNKEKKICAILLTISMSFYWFLICFITYTSFLAGNDLAKQGESPTALYIISLYLGILVLSKIYSAVTAVLKKEKPSE